MTAMMPDGLLAAAAVTNSDSRGLLLVWNGNTGKLLHTFPTTATAAAFSTDGSLLAAGDDQGQIQVFSLKTGKQLATLQAGHNTIHCLAFTRDRVRNASPEDSTRNANAIPHQDADGQGWLLAAGDAGGNMTIWDLGLRIPRSYCRGSPYDVFAVAFSPDERHAGIGRSCTRVSLSTMGHCYRTAAFGAWRLRFHCCWRFLPMGETLFLATYRSLTRLSRSVSGTCNSAAAFGSIAD